MGNREAAIISILWPKAGPAINDKTFDLRYADKNRAIDVTIQDESLPSCYDAVFNSASLVAMQRMDLSGLNLNWEMEQSIRSLGYEAQRVASLINNKSLDAEEELRTLLIDKFAKLHSKTNDQNDHNRVHRTLSNAYEKHHAYDCDADPSTTGAFGYFGPSQFHKMYPSITCSHGKHMIIGEAASTHHAWVVGALESAVRGVYPFFYRHSKHNKAANEAVRLYHHDKIVSPHGPLPAAFDRMPDLELIGAGEQAAANSDKGEWAREQVIFESTRLEQGVDQLLSGGELVSDVQLDSKIVEAAWVAALTEVMAAAWSL